MERSDGVTTTYDRGLEVRREVLGADHVDRSLQNASEFTRPMQELVTEYCWGRGLEPGRPRPPHAQPPQPGHAHRAESRPRARGPRARSDHQRVHNGRDSRNAASGGGVLRDARRARVVPGRGAGARGDYAGRLSDQGWMPAHLRDVAALHAGDRRFVAELGALSRQSQTHGRLTTCGPSRSSRARRRSA